MAQPAKTLAKTYQIEDRPPPGAAGERLPMAEAPLMLALDDLVLDKAGEVVLFNDLGLRTLALSAAISVTDEGDVGKHVTAAGEDVSGFRYLRFANGLKLYYQQGLDVLVVTEPPQIG